MLIKIEISSALPITIPVSGKNLKRDHWDVDEDTRVEEILDTLNISEIPTLLIINGHVVSEDRILKEGDTLKIFPLVSGG
jgi:sulfur carrier protein ThiS